MRKSDAIEFFGSQAKFARAINRSESTVSGYSETLPLGIAVTVEKLSHRKCKVDYSLYPKLPESLRP
jgi:hypothetical protein